MFGKLVKEKKKKDPRDREIFSRFLNVGGNEPTWH